MYTGQDRRRTARTQDRMDTGKEGYRAGRLQDMMAAGQDSASNSGRGWMLDRRNKGRRYAGHDGRMTGWTKDKMDVGQFGCRTG